MKSSSEFILKRASVDDVDAIFALLDFFALRKLLLPKTKDQLYRQIRDFRVIYKIGVKDDENAQNETAAQRAVSRLRRTNDRNVLRVHKDHEDNENAENGVLQRSLIACAHLDIFTNQLAEVKSLAVHEAFHGQGLGRMLVEDCENEARSMQIKTIFALTYQIKFFEKIGYHLVDIQSLPEKVFKECVVCPFYGACNENALIKRL
ncbi:MAG: GNAT family N-acetyltransferase [bacterium]